VVDALRDFVAFDLPEGIKWIPKKYPYQHAKGISQVE
jgi:hypothetical protein